jgi:mannose-6-phosphate isomerase-like protein (cupin superfamily)
MIANTIRGALALTVFGLTLIAQSKNPETKSAMNQDASAKPPVAHAFAIDELRSQRQKSGNAYLPFFKVPSMRMGVYALGAGAEDKQSPHDEDEVYYVLSGRGTLRVESEEHPVQPGSLVFVAAHATHKFHSITEPLEVLVFFSAAAAAPHH